MLSVWTYDSSCRVYCAWKDKSRIEGYAAELRELATMNCSE